MTATAVSGGAGEIGLVNSTVRANAKLRNGLLGPAVTSAMRRGGRHDAGYGKAGVDACGKRRGKKCAKSVQAPKSAVYGKDVSASESLGVRTAY